MKTKRKVTVHNVPLKKKRMQRVKTVACATAIVAAQVMVKGESSPCDVFLPGIHWYW